jgi:hypothetical protein
MWYLIPCFIYSVLLLGSSTGFGVRCNMSISLAHSTIGIMLILLNFYIFYNCIRYDIYTYSNNIITHSIFYFNVYLTYIRMFLQSLMCYAHIYDSDLPHIVKNIRLCRNRSFISFVKEPKYVYNFGRFDYPELYILITSAPTIIFVILLYNNLNFYLGYIMIIHFILTILYTVL